MRYLVSCVTRPPTIVSHASILGSDAASASSGSSVSTTRSAAMPRRIVPVSRSAWLRHAACSGVRRWIGRCHLRGQPFRDRGGWSRLLRPNLYGRRPADGGRERPRRGVVPERACHDAVRPDRTRSARGFGSVIELKRSDRAAGALPAAALCRASALRAQARPCSKQRLNRRSFAIRHLTCSERRLNEPFPSVRTPVGTRHVPNVKRRAVETALLSSH